MEKFEEGQRLSEERFKKLFSQKPPPPKKKKKEKTIAQTIHETKPQKKTTAPETRTPQPHDLDPEVEPEDDYFDKPQPRQRQRFTPQEMQVAEEEIQRRQVLEYKEKESRDPETQAAMDNKLLQIEARIAVEKELMDAEDPSGVHRKMAIEINEDYPEVFTEDMVKGNFGDAERACLFGNISTINAMKTIGQAKGFDFKAACRFNKAQMDAITNISRAKAGFSAVLAKTDKHVSEGLISHVQHQFEEKKSKKWGVF